MFRRYRGRPSPAPMGGVTASRDITSARRAETVGRKPRGPLEYTLGEGWGWYFGELVCPLAGLLTLNRSHGQHPEERCDEA
jgi:hypothetical protein